MMAESGYLEVEHTADWMLAVWAPNLEELLLQAAQGMYTLAGTRLEAGPRQQADLEIAAPDAESLLVCFLSELLYAGERDGLGFDQFDLHLDEFTLRAHLQGAPLAFQAKEIKAVTYHNLKICTTARGLETRIVFDV